VPEKRRIYDDEFKRDAIRLVANNSYGVSETARRLGINAKMLSRWKREAETTPNGVFTGTGTASPEQDELRRLRAENQRLRMERDILKKTVGFFASESS
jgi:transposase